jgi:hypothetical protein
MQDHSSALRSRANMRWHTNLNKTLLSKREPSKPKRKATYHVEFAFVHCRRHDKRDNSARRQRVVSIYDSPQATLVNCSASVETRPVQPQKYGTCTTLQLVKLSSYIQMLLLQRSLIGIISLRIIKCA